MGELGQAKLIDFVPCIKATQVQIPESVVFVIGNSCTQSPKLLTLGTRYNKRVVECRFALCAMSIKAGTCSDFASCPFKTFQQLQAHLNYDFKQMLDLVNTSFQKTTAYTPKEMTNEWGVEDPFEIVAEVPHVNEVKKSNINFELYKRAHHVLSEAKRVHDFKAICQNESSKQLDEDQKVKALGELMNASQESCREYYDCSSPELDEITTLAKNSGALGSRLTGAGWGGCSVSLVKKSELKDFIDKMYYFYEREREDG